MRGPARRSGPWPLVAGITVPALSGSDLLGMGFLQEIRRHGGLLVFTRSTSTTGLSRLVAWIEKNCYADFGGDFSMLGHVSRCKSVLKMEKDFQ